MIGTHDSYTYENPKKGIFKLFKKFWRTQKFSVEEQYKRGVRFFDIRVTWDNKYKIWRTAHGAVDFKRAKVNYWGQTEPRKGTIYSPLRSLMEYMYRLPYNMLGRKYLTIHDAYYRILLEKGEKGRFLDELKDIIKASDFHLYANQCWQIVIKDNWEVLWERNYGISKDLDLYTDIRDYTYIPWSSGESLGYNIKNFKFDSIKSCAKRANKNHPISDEMANDPNVIYFYDYPDLSKITKVPTFVLPERRKIQGRYKNSQIWSYIKSDRLKSMIGETWSKYVDPSTDPVDPTKPPTEPPTTPPTQGTE